MSRMVSDSPASRRRASSVAVISTSSRLTASMLPPMLSGVSEHAFSVTERTAVYRAIAERRDMRRFMPNAEVPEGLLVKLLQAAHAAPSVGLMQPWRFIRITDAGLRTRIHALVDEERVRTAEALGPRSDEFLALKVEGILECAELLVVALWRRQAGTC